jgi:hypothetical protein
MVAQPSYEKFDPIAGGFRARLGEVLPISGSGYFGLVSLNASGRVVTGDKGDSGPVGVLVKNVVRQPVGRFQTPPGAAGDNFMQNRVGDAVDILQLGEIVGLDPDDFPAGAKVYATAAGVISTDEAAGSYLIGFMVENRNGPRLRVNVMAGITAQA